MLTFCYKIQYFNECKQNQSNQTNDCDIGSHRKNEIDGHLICNYVEIKKRNRNLKDC